MADHDRKAKAARELLEWFLNAAYLSLFLCTFSVYRILVSEEAHHDIAELQLGANILTAVIIAKTMMIGGWLRIGERSRDEEAPLITVTLYRSLIYGVFVFLISIVEKILGGFIRGMRARDTFSALAQLGWQEITARTIVILLAFIPYFAFRELARRDGYDQVYELLFHRQR